MYANLDVGALGHKASLVDAIGYAQRYGFRGVSISIVEADEMVQAEGIERLRSRFEGAGLRIGTFSFPFEWRRDEATWRAGLEQLPRLAKLAVELGCTRTTTWIMPCDDERDYFENFQFHVTRLRPIVEILADAGCRFGLEFVGPRTLRKTRKYPFVYTMDGVRALGAATARRGAGLLLDAFHLYVSHGSNADIADLSNEDVVLVHINDAPPNIEIDEQQDRIRAMPGETGVLDLSGFLQALEAIGYDGPVTAEPFSDRVRAMATDEACKATGAAVLGVMRAAGVGLG